MAIHTSSNFYRRGIPNSYNNFAFVAQTNNTIPSPLSVYVKSFQFYNRNITRFTSGPQSLPWKK